jgi:hypothetical protein
VGYDVRVLELAEAFLGDEPVLRGRARELAEHIQMSIEEWIAAAMEESDAIEEGEVEEGDLGEHRGDAKKRVP